MSNKRKKQKTFFKPQQPFIATQKAPNPPAKPVVNSLIDQMINGREYESLLNVVPENGWSPNDDFNKAIGEIEAIRKRPMLLYVANVVKHLPGAATGIDTSDDLPFSEMIDSAPDSKEVDIFLVTPGGMAQQVSHFVNRIRAKFDNVGFILPHMALSAGTIWALSGNEIWMSDRAYLGPIDPQVPGKNGGLLPAQSLQLLVKEIQERGDTAIKSGHNPNWTDVEILRNIDPKELGNALSGSNYSIQLASDFLSRYKFSDWTTHGDGSVVTPEERTKRAEEIAKHLCNHGLWKAHSHGISRKVANDELRIMINRPEDLKGLLPAIRRLWALFYWMFENTPVYKILASQNFKLYRSVQVKGAPNG